MVRVSKEKKRREKIRQEKESEERRRRRAKRYESREPLCFSRSKGRIAKAAGAEPSGQMRDEKLHAVVARSTCQVKMHKHLSVGALLGIEMSKKCTPSWRQIHFQVKIYKTHHVRSTFGS